jgi:hypothetical protein
VLFQLQVAELAEPKHAVPVTEKDVESEDGDVEHPDGELMANSVDMNKVDAALLAAHVRIKSKAAIPEASPPSHRCKRQVDTADQENLERAEKMKAARNLDPSPEQGSNESSDKSFLNYSIL